MARRSRNHSGAVAAAVALPRAQSWIAPRTALAFLWFSGLSLCVLLVFYLYLDSWIEGDTMRTALKSISGLYAPYVAAIGAFFWSGRRASSETFTWDGGIVLAVIASALWNLIPIGFLGAVPAGTVGIENAVENMQDITAAFSWLVAGAIGFYFGRAAFSEKTGSGDQ